MKNFLFLTLIVAISIGNVLAQTSRTMFFCCSPGGFCGTRAFDSFTVCQAACGGTNRCEARGVAVTAVTTAVAPAAISGVSLATPTGLVTGATTAMTPIVAGGATIAVPGAPFLSPVAQTVTVAPVSTVIRGR